MRDLSPKVAKCLRHFPAAIRGGAQRRGDDTTQIRRLERTQRGLRRASFRSDFGAQAREIAIALTRHEP